MAAMPFNNGYAPSILVNKPLNIHDDTRTIDEKVLQLNKPMGIFTGIVTGKLFMWYFISDIIL